eukprot:m.306009 g.306009  ORF g.306009 m.306009 type:complete len:145 (+) comp40895_c0_seq1:133-567(+)
MALSGIAIMDDVVDTFAAMKTKHTLSYMQMRISDNQKEVEVSHKEEKGGSTEENWAKLVGTLDDNPCWFVFDFIYETGEGHKREKLVFLQWAPDTAPTKKKMLVASTKDALKKKLNGLQVLIEANDKEEVDFETVSKRVKESSK